MLTTIIFISCDQDDTKILLTTSADPEDAGTVLPSTRQYNDGDTAKLIASPSDGYLFESWTGATGDAETEILMDSDKTVVEILQKFNSNSLSMLSEKELFHKRL